MGRTWAIIERELRRFRRSPVLIAMSMVMPIAQLVILGYAFGGNVKHLKLAIVDQDHGVPAIRVRVLAKNEPRVALIADNTDGFVSVALAGTLGSMLSAYNQPARTPRIAGVTA